MQKTDATSECHGTFVAAGTRARTREQPKRSRTGNRSDKKTVDNPASQSTSSGVNKAGEMKAKLERSRQSARECRARKKLRYQYLEELVSHREKAVLQLREELDQYRGWCKAVDQGHVPDDLRKALAETNHYCEEYTNDV